MNALQKATNVSFFLNESNFPLWKPDHFLQYSHSLKEVVRVILLLNLRSTSFFRLLPRDIIFILFTILEEITSPFWDSILLSHFHQCTLSQWIPKVEKWGLLYRASRDGFSGKAFHSHCDRKGPTYSIIKANGFLFGGYTSISWESALSSRRGKGKTFIFTLTNPHNIPPTQYLMKNGNPQQICDHHFFGPCFGDTDIFVDFKYGSFHQFPVSFIDTTGKGQSTFTPRHNWEVEELEVFGIHN
jgi:hypothetical protein